MVNISGLSAVAELLFNLFSERRPVSRSYVRESVFRRTDEVDCARCVDMMMIGKWSELSIFRFSNHMM